MAGLEPAPSQRVDPEQQRAAAALDRERHVESVRRWLERLGYTPQSAAESGHSDVRRLGRVILEEENAMAPTPREGTQRVSGFRSSVMLRWLEPGEQPPVAAPRTSLAAELVRVLSAEPGRWAHLQDPGPSLGDALRQQGVTVIVHRNGAGRELFAQMPAADG